LARAWWWALLWARSRTACECACRVWWPQPAVAWLQAWRVCVWGGGGLSRVSRAVLLPGAHMPAAREHAAVCCARSYTHALTALTAR
jgi:hypothetical protein